VLGVLIVVLCPDRVADLGFGARERGRAEVFALPIGSHGAHRQAQFRFSISVRQGPWRLGHRAHRRSIEEERRMQVVVRDNNVDQALKVLKKKMQREGSYARAPFASDFGAIVTGAR
jgi:hypothetical protein